jgi:hypothetical protein
MQTVAPHAPIGRLIPAYGDGRGRKRGSISDSSGLNETGSDESRSQEDYAESISHDEYLTVFVTLRNPAFADRKSGVWRFQVGCFAPKRAQRGEAATRKDAVSAYRRIGVSARLGETPKGRRQQSTFGLTNVDCVDPTLGRRTHRPERAADNLGR